jgi:hypothetical protein
MSDAILLKRLPDGVDARGPQQRDALGRAFVADRWRHRKDPPKRASSIPRNMIRFGRLAKA